MVKDVKPDSVRVDDDTDDTIRIADIIARSNEARLYHQALCILLQELCAAFKNSYENNEFLACWSWTPTGPAAQGDNNPSQAMYLIFKECLASLTKQIENPPLEAQYNPNYWTRYLNQARIYYFSPLLTHINDIQENQLRPQNCQEVMKTELLLRNLFTKLDQFITNSIIYVKENNLSTETAAKEVGHRLKNFKTQIQKFSGTVLAEALQHDDQLYRQFVLRKVPAESPHTTPTKAGYLPPSFPASTPQAATNTDHFETDSNDSDSESNHSSPTINDGSPHDILSPAFPQENITTKTLRFLSPHQKPPVKATTEVAASVGQLPLNSQTTDLRIPLLLNSSYTGDNN